MESKFEFYPSFFSESSRCGACDDVRDRGGRPSTATGGGDFYAGIGDHRLVIEENGGKGRGAGRDENEDFTLFFIFRIESGRGS